MYFFTNEGTNKTKQLRDFWQLYVIQKYSIEQLCLFPRNVYQTITLGRCYQTQDRYVIVLLESKLQYKYYELYSK